MTAPRECPLTWGGLGERGSVGATLCKDLGKSWSRLKSMGFRPLTYRARMKGPYGTSLLRPQNHLGGFYRDGSPRAPLLCTGVSTRCTQPGSMGLSGLAVCKPVPQGPHCARNLGPSAMLMGPPAPRRSSDSGWQGELRRVARWLKQKCRTLLPPPSKKNNTGKKFC